MKGFTNKRPKIPSRNQTSVLLACKRRCCLCFGLETDLSYKRIQIAHLDHNRQNNKIDNLAALCKPHHDEYDITSHQTKRLTANEVKHYRSELSKILAKRAENIMLEFADSPQEEQRSLSSAKLLGQILEAYDTENERIQTKSRPNGIKLLHLAKCALQEEGDFGSVLEAYLCLVRLSSAALSPDGFCRLRQPVSSSTPVLAASHILQLAAKTDWELGNQLIRKSWLHALVGDASNSALSRYEALPHVSFEVITTLFASTCRENYSKEMSKMLSVLANLGMGYGLALVQQGIDLPEPPKEIWYTSSMQRTISEQQPKTHLPLIRLANKIACLPQDLFEKVLHHFKYRMGFAAMGEPVVHVDPDRGVQRDKAIEFIKTWAVLPNYASSYLEVESEALKTHATELIMQNLSLGKQVANCMKEICIAERQCLMKKPNNPTGVST